jgi:AcrR family transcriptional regulator
MTGTRTRLPAAERRHAILEAALRIFAGGSYSGATTADMRGAGISEPILWERFLSIARERGRWLSAR